MSHIATSVSMAPTFQRKQIGKMLIIKEVTATFFSGTGGARLFNVIAAFSRADGKSGVI